jgi:hypothetical protein
MPGKAEREQFNDLYDRAWGTALAQNPPPVTVPPEWIPTVAEPLTPWPTDPRIPAGAGWISNVQGPRPFPLVAKVYNFWVERTDDDGIIVYAGSLYDNAAQGTLLIQRLNEFGPIDAEPEIYTAPQQAGGIRIVDAIGERLTLRADDGTLFYFDVLTRQWVNPAPSPSTEVPTYDPQAYHATVVAIVATLPTASPIPGLPPDKTQDRQTNDLWDRAERTAVAMNPPPNPYPTEQVATPAVLTTPEGETPHQVAGAGIIWQEKWSPHFSKLMYTLNQWVERENQQGNSVLVCAGSKSPREDPQQGIIGILIQVPNSGTVVSGPDLYLTPLRAGAVQVIDAVGERLTLRADDGTLFYFDVLTRQWVTPDPPPGPSPIPSSLPPTP